MLFWISFYARYSLQGSRSAPAGRSCRSTSTHGGNRVARYCTSLNIMATDQQLTFCCDVLGRNRSQRELSPINLAKEVGNRNPILVSSPSTRPLTSISTRQHTHMEHYETNFTHAIAGQSIRPCKASNAPRHPHPFLSPASPAQEEREKATKGEHFSALFILPLEVKPWRARHCPYLYSACPRGVGWMDGMGWDSASAQHGGVRTILK